MSSLSAMESQQNLRIGIAGFGAVGRNLALALHRGIDGLSLAAIASRDAERVRATLPDGATPAVVPIAELPDHADLIVECAPAAILASIAEPALRAGRMLVVLSCGALLDNEHLVHLARAHGGRILVPTGALIGLDAVLAAAEGRIASVTMTSRKPPAGLAGAPYLVQNGIDVSQATEPVRVFEGSAREAARGFPANVNVAVALSLAGIGADRTRIAIWADPTISRNTHLIEVESDAASFSMTIAGVPSENPRTGKITAQSVIALLRKLRAPLAVGT
ncbi:aspartate dehydrogenase [Rhizobiales bacterium GAS191]|nr:aspartate dehydrogenase [Rhizobiales bacterium GAS113]SEB98224.1 aspartate dehydrogenase [Rhizobiales bacterium GAS191]